MFPQLSFAGNLDLRLNEPCGRIFCGPNWERTRENSLSLRDWELWLVWRGRGWMRTGYGTHPLFAGFCALMRPGGIYDAGHDDDDRLGITYIHFDVMRAGSGAAAAGGAAKGRRPARGFASGVAGIQPPHVVAGTAAELARIETAEAGAAAAIATGGQMPQINREQHLWPEFFILEDIEYAELLTRRIIEQLADNVPAATALLYAFLADLLEREPLDPRAWDGAEKAPASERGRHAEHRHGTGTQGDAAVLDSPDGVGAKVEIDVKIKPEAEAGLGGTGKGANINVTDSARRHRNSSRAGTSAGTGTSSGGSASTGSVRRVPHYREIQQLIATVRTVSPESLPSVAQMAAKVGISQEHFSRLFRRVSGRSPMQFIVGLRTTHARHLLRESSLSVSEIADRLGYGDVYFFSRQFKEQTGLSPLAYRQQG